MSDRDPEAQGWRIAIVGLFLFAATIVPGPRDELGPAGSLAAQVTRRLDPAAWGSDHVGRAVPEYLTGDECLFCHRLDIAPGFAENRHRLTIRTVGDSPDAVKALEQRPATSAVVKSVVYLLGGTRRQRFLKPSQAYGRLELLSTQWEPPREGKPGGLVDPDRPRWDASTFADACAGCHATAVDPATRSFSAASLDCYVCHGAVDPNHSKDTTLVHLSRARRDPPRVVTSVCAQCHLRTGRSRSTGVPYPNTFVAGDNLFRDFQVDLSPAAIARLDPADRHVQENVRDVVELGREEVTCLSCHDVHGQSSAKHRRVGRSGLCLNCHDAGGTQTTFTPAKSRSVTCRY